MKAYAAVACLLALPLLGATKTKPDDVRSRRFQLTYRTALRIPEGARRVDLWIPYPTSDANQDIKDVVVSAPYPTEIGKDPEYGNSILHLATVSPRENDIVVELTLEVERRENVRRDFDSLPEQALGPDDPSLKRWLAPDRLVPIDGAIRSLAEEVARGKKTRLEKARAIYDYTVDNLKYDKSGTGWGRGDVYYACDVKRGNCTDFHAVFIGFARALGIPAKFAIGFPLPPERGEGEIAGYHCWAEFHLPGHGWIPVDTSEANKNRSRREYFFGAHDENRVQFTIGRDVLLEPPQSGAPLNFFVYPYGEADGKEITEILSRFFYKDLDRP